MRKHLSSILSILMLTIFGVGLSACGGGGIETNTDPIEPIQSNSVTLSLFSLGSDFPTDIKAPSLSGAPATAFVVTDFPAMGVLAIDLESFTLSDYFAGLDATVPEISGVAFYSRKVEILSETQAYYLGGNALVSFNPKSGDVLEIVNLSAPISLTQEISLAESCDYDFDGNPDSTLAVGTNFSPNAADDFIIHNNQLIISVDNGCFGGSDGYTYAQSILLKYDLNALQNTPEVLVLDGFNATDLKISGDKLYVAISGDTAIIDGEGVAQTDTIFQEVELNTFSLSGRSLNLGLFYGSEMELDPDGISLWLSSKAFSKIKKIDLNTLTEVDEVALFEEEKNSISDLLVDPERNALFAAAFNSNNIRALNVANGSFELLPDIFDLTFTGQPEGTRSGAGPMALHPTEEGVILTLTSSPGTLSKIAY